MLAHRAQGITGPGKFQEQPTPRSGQEKLLAGFGPTWLKAARSSQEAPGATQEHPGVARKSSWLTLGILANMAKGSQEQPRKLQEQPKSTEEWPGGVPGWIWASWATWLRAAISSPGNSRSSPRAPRSGQEEPLAGFGHPWPTWLRAVPQNERVQRGGFLYKHTNVCRR